MTNETTEMWREVRERRRRHRETLLDAASGQLEGMADAVTSRDQRCVLTEAAHGHYTIRRDGRVVVQWWPSGEKWQVLPPGRVTRGGINKFRKFVQEGEW